MRQRLDKILSKMGYGSRKEIKKVVKKGNVLVDDQVVTDHGMHIDPFNQKIEIFGEIVQYREYVYIMLNKPQGVITATEDLQHKTVVDLLQGEYDSFQLFPVGRLDKDTEGLLILTNDGKLSHRLLAPKRHVPKTYFAKIEGEVSKEDQELFKKGVTLDDGYLTMPSELLILHTGSISEIEITIYEGKFHQIKRMFNAVGKRVVYLKRLSMGRLYLDHNLQPGEYRELTETEIKLLHK